jgi:1,2-diacylglycerol 3-beta-galactosyltransferase
MTSESDTGQSRGIRRCSSRNGITVTEWVAQNGLGVVLGSFRTVRAAITELTNNLPQWQAQVRQMQNRAVFEIPDILANLQPLEQLPPRR